MDNGIELRIGRTDNLHDNGLYWCFNSNLTLKEVKIIIKERLATDIYYRHYLDNLKIVLWKDWENWLTYSEVHPRIFLEKDTKHDSLTLRELVNKIELTELKGQRIRNSVIVEIPIKENPDK